MRPFFSALFFGSLLVGFIFPPAWIVAFLAGPLAIFSAPAGQRPDGREKTGGLLGWLWDYFVIKQKMQECPYCLSMIDRNAVKCAHCGEWIPDDDEEKYEDEDEDDQAYADGDEEFKE